MSAKRKKRPARKDPKSQESLENFIATYLAGIQKELKTRWKVWPVSVTVHQESEVLIGLLRHQVALAENLARSPQSWNMEVAPIFLRCMVETYISLAWILEKPSERGKLFIEDGLGKEKLMIMHRMDELKLLGRSADDDPLVQMSMAWVESQKYSFSVDVNLSGSWSGIDLRKMAEEAGCRDFYRFTYPSFSSAVHGTWNHISRYDLLTCNNPLHAHHKIPRFDSPSGSSWALNLAASYLAKTFQHIDVKLKLDIAVPSTYQVLFLDRSTQKRKKNK